jgi:hypothetical protein
MLLIQLRHTRQHRLFRPKTFTTPLTSSNRNGSVLMVLHHRSQPIRSLQEHVLSNCLPRIIFFSQKDQHADIRRQDVSKGIMVFSDLSFTVSLLLIHPPRYRSSSLAVYSAVTRCLEIAYANRSSSLGVTRPHSDRYLNRFCIQA